MGFTAEQLGWLAEIHDVALRYCRGVDRLDADTMRSAYWPDAIDDHGNFVGNAWQFVDHCMTAHDRWRWTMHTISNHLVDFDDDTTARGEIYNVTHLCRADDGAIETWFGRYLDRYERRGDEWRIIHRVCVHHGDHRAEASPMQMDTSRYRDGGFDRPLDGRPLGP